MPSGKSKTNVIRVCHLLYVQFTLPQNIQTNSLTQCSSSHSSVSAFRTIFGLTHYQLQQITGLTGGESLPNSLEWPDFKFHSVNFVSRAPLACRVQCFSSFLM